MNNKRSKYNDCIHTKQNDINIDYLIAVNKKINYICIVHDNDESICNIYACSGVKVMTNNNRQCSYIA
jgi:hypothetical protein